MGDKPAIACVLCCAACTIHMHRVDHSDDGGIEMSILFGQSDDGRGNRISLLGHDRSVISTALASQVPEVEHAIGQLMACAIAMYQRPEFRATEEERAIAAAMQKPAGHA